MHAFICAFFEKKINSFSSPEVANGKSWIELWQLKWASKEIVCSTNIEEHRAEMVYCRRWWWWCVSTHFLGWLIQLWVCVRFFCYKNDIFKLHMFQPTEGNFSLKFKMCIILENRTVHITQATLHTIKMKQYEYEQCKLCANNDDSKWWQNMIQNGGPISTTAFVLLYCFFLLFSLRKQFHYFFSSIDLLLGLRGREAPNGRENHCSKYRWIKTDARRTEIISKNEERKKKKLIVILTRVGI